MWQLGITGRTRGHIAVLIGGQAFKYKTIKFDKALYDDMILKAVNFWDMVQSKTPPMATEIDKECLLELHPKNLSDDMVQATEEMETEIARRQELSMHISQMKEEKEEIENKLRQVIGNNLGVITKKYRVTYKHQATRPTILTDLMKADGVYQKYTEPNFTRVLRINLKKEKK